MFDILLRLYNNAVNYFASPEWERLRFILKTISTILMITFTILIVMILKWISELNKKMEFPTEKTTEPMKEKTDEMLLKWKKIENYLESDNENDWKISIIEADQLLDDILAKANFPGKSLSERLSHIDSSEFPMINDILYAHKIRNNIVHDNNFKITRDDAKRILEIYKKTFDDLELF